VILVQSVLFGTTWRWVIVNLLVKHQSKRSNSQPGYPRCQKA